MGTEVSPNFGIYTPNVVDEFCARVVSDTMLPHQRETEGFCVAFYDAACSSGEWESCGR